MYFHFKLFKPNSILLLFALEQAKHILKENSKGKVK